MGLEAMGQLAKGPWGRGAKRHRATRHGRSAGTDEAKLKGGAAEEPGQQPNRRSPNMAPHGPWKKLVKD